MSAATFRRSGQLAQCLVAIQEAELLDIENADVWVQVSDDLVSLLWIDGMLMMDSYRTAWSLSYGTRRISIGDRIIC